MANVPGVLLIGNSQVQGGSTSGVAADFTSVGTTALAAFKELDVMRITPSSNVTGAPTAASLGWYPWFDSGADDTLYAVAASPAPTATTISVSPSPAWTVNEWTGRVVSLVNTPVTIGFAQRRQVVSNTADTITVASWIAGTPTAGQSFFLGRGRFRDYHPSGGYLFPTETLFSLRGGSTVDALGAGVGPEAGLIRQLLEHVWATAPYFQIAKFAHIGKTVGDWDGASATRTLFEARLTAIAAAWTALANGNTLAWEFVVIDQSQTDVIDWATNPLHYLSYQSSLETMISYVRTQLGNASLKVLLVNHDNTINNVLSPGGTLSANRIHRTIAAADPYVRIVSMQGERTNGTTAYAVAAENRPYYAASVYWDSMARKLREGYELLAASAEPIYEGSLPCYIFIGDSICAGAFNAAYTDALRSPTLTSTPRAATQSIYNAQNGTGEPYDVGDNSNTSGQVDTNAGPECSMMVELEALHPEGFLLIKRGSSSSSLIADFAAYVGTGTSGGRWSHSISSEHWDALVLLWEEALLYAHTTLGKQLDLKGIFVILGNNDAATAGGGALFAAELATFVADLRTAFQTRTSGTDLPIVWRKPQLDYANAITDEIVELRAALEDYALTDPQFALVDVDDLERTTVDNIHENGDSAMIDGQRQVAALAAIAV